MSLSRLDKPSFGGSVRPTRANETVGDGVVRDGLALRIDREADGPAPERTKTERARLFLQALRMGDEGGNLTFGKTIFGGIDAVTSLKSYYPSIEIANALAEAFPAGGGGIANYLDALSVPEDLRGLVATLVEAKFGGAVGNVATWENNADYKVLYQQWQANNIEVTKINDATIEKLYGAWKFPTQNFHKYVQNRPDPMKVGLVHMLARAVELGIPSQSQPAHVAAHMPANEEGATAIKRLAAAMNIPENTVNFHGKMLDQWGGKFVARPAAAARVANRPGRPLGRTTTWVNDPDHNKWWAAFTQADPSSVTVDDATLTKIFNQWGVGKNINGFRNYGDANFKVNVIKMFARARELGLPVGAQAPHINQISNQLPISPAGIHAMHRIATAFGLQYNQLTIANQSLTQHPDPGGGDGDGPVLPEPAPCGKKGGDLAAIQKMLADGDEAILRLDDEALKILTQAAPQLNVIGQKSLEVDWHIGLIQLAARSIKVGARNVQHFQQYIQTIPNNVLLDPRAADALALAVRQSGVVDTAPLANGQTLIACEETGRALRKLDRVLEGASARLPRKRSIEGAAAEPLGNDQTPYNNYWGTRDVRFFELSDQQIAAWNNNQPVQILNQFHNNPLSFKYFARLCETMPASGSANHGRAFLQQPIPAQYMSDEAIPYLLRMAKALDVDPATVRVHVGGQVVSLEAHPAYRMVTGADDDAPARIAALHEDLAELDPANGQHQSVLEGAIMRLLFSDGDALHELDELFPALIQARTDGRLEPVDLMGVPKDYAEKFLNDALEDRQHIGAAAVLIGLMTKAPIGVVRDVLAAQGYFPQQVDRYADVATSLSKMPATDVAFVLADLAREPNDPDFTSIELRVELTKTLVSKPRLEKLTEEADPMMVVRAALDRAAQLPEGDRARKDLLSFVDGLVKKEVISQDDVHASLALDTAVRLDTKRVAQLDKVVNACIAANDDEFPAALDKLVTNLADGSKFLDPTALTTRAMSTFYAEDLKHVAPLGETDEILGGVEGKPWDVRANDDVPKVNIEGVALVVDTRPDRAEHAIPKMEASPKFVTKAGRHTLRLLAARWRVPGPIHFAGVGAHDMSDAIEWIANQTQNAYRRIHLNDYADPAQLLAADGPIVKAALAGEVVHMVADKPISPELLNVLQTAFDAKGNLQPPPPGQPVVSDPNFRLVFSDARRPANVQSPPLPGFSTLNIRAIDGGDLTKMLVAENESLPEPVAQQLTGLYTALENALNAGNFGDPPPKFGVERIEAAARRLANVQPDADGVIDPGDIRRIVEEVYAGSIHPAYLNNLNAQLNAVVPGQAAAPNETDLRLVKGSVSIDGITIPRDPKAAKFTKDDIEALGLTKQMAHVLRAMGEALEHGESINLLGPPLPAVASLEESYAMICGRPYARYIATPTTPVSDFIDPATGGFKADFDGAVIVIESFEDASQSFRDIITAAADRSRADGEGVRLIARQIVEVQNQNPSTPASMTVLRLDGVQDAGGEQAIVEAAAKRMGLPESVATSLYQLHGRVNQAYQGNQIGQNLNPKPVHVLNELFGAMKLALELIPEIGMASAYITAVETFYGAQLAADTVQIMNIAREIAK